MDDGADVHVVNIESCGKSGRKIPLVQSQTLCGGKRKYDEITAAETGKVVAEALAKYEPPAQRTKTATTSNFAVAKASVRPLASLRKSERIQKPDWNNFQ